MTCSSHSSDPSKSAGLARRLVGVLLATLLPCSLPASSSVEETVDRALEDLQSDKEEMRRGAAMLLGKYPAEAPVLPALLDLLQDPARTVRRAAVISLAENAARLNSNEARSLVMALGDEDSEVRLGVAAFLPQLILRATRMPSANGTAVVSGNDRAALDKALLAALGDSLPEIRIQALEALRYIPWRLPPEEVARRLGDPAPEVRMAAYAVLVNRLSPLDFSAAVLEHLPEPNREARLVLAESLTSGQPSPEYGPLMEQLAMDEDAEVRILGLAGRFLLSPEKGPDASLVRAMLREELSASLVVRLFAALRHLPPQEAGPVTETLLKADSSLVRGQATRLWLQLLAEAPRKEHFLELVRDPSPEVRQEALRFLAGNPDLLSVDWLIPLTESEFVDVRLRVLSLSRNLPPEGSTQLALRLLMDTQPDIRRGALDRLATIRPARWQSLFRASLRDPSPRVQQAAVRHLIRGFGAEGQKIARDYARAHPGEAVVTTIRTEFSRLSSDRRTSKP